MVDFLPAVYQENWHLETAPPRVIASYETLIFPFDKWIWSYLWITLAGIAILAIGMLLLKKTITRGSYDYVLEGMHNAAQFVN